MSHRLFAVNILESPYKVYCSEHSYVNLVVNIVLITLVAAIELLITSLYNSG